MSYRLHWSALFATLLGIGCSGAGPSTPQNLVPTDSPSPQVTDAIGPLAASGPGLVEGVIGLTQLSVNPDTLSASVEPLRASQTQGDLYHLSIRPFFGPGDLEVTKVRRGGSGTVIVTMKFRHPFAAPADLTPPATAAKRIDLHVFDVNALVVTDGTDTFFNGTDDVLTNGGLLVNADAYRNPGGTFDPLSMGVAANTFPYKLVARNIDTVNPAGNYVPTANGWTGPALLDPFGYDVFPQGAEVEVDFELDISIQSSFNLVTLAKYMDPRATPQPKNKRLPVPGDPTSLQYILPEAAGDVQRIDVVVGGTLEAGSSSEIVTLDVTVLDWDHGFTIANPFPNQADLSEISELSAVATVSADVQLVRNSGPMSFPGVAGAAPLLTTTGALTNEAAYDPAGGDVVKGLVRVTDTQDETNPPSPVTLGEDLLPSTQVSSTRYQFFQVTVDPGASGPTCPIYAVGAPALQATQNVSFRLDLDTATTPATDPEGIAGYRVDYNGDSTWDTGIRMPDGTPAPDFTADPAWTYATTGPQSLKLEIRDNNIPPDITICDFTVTVTPSAGLVLDPLPTPGGINWEMGSQTVSTIFGVAPVLLADGVGDFYHLLYKSATPANGLYVYRSTDGGLTWPGVSNPLPLFANGAYGIQGSSFSLGVLANGLPAVAARDGDNDGAGSDNGQDLTYIAAQSEAAGTINWGGVTAGVQIENLGNWNQVNLVTHRSNANRAYIIAMNTSNTVGPNFDQISVWFSSNASSANPTFTLLPGVADTVDGATVEEDYLRAIMDYSGGLHLVWIKEVAGEMYYRKFVDDGTAGGGAYAGPETVIATRLDAATFNFRDVDIAVDLDNDLAVVWKDEDFASPFGSIYGNAIYLRKFTTGTGWGSVLKINNPSLVEENFIFFPSVDFDTAGRIHVVWRDNRQTPGGTAHYEPWGAVINPAGTTKVVDDFEVMPAGNVTDDFASAPHIAYSPTLNKLLVQDVKDGTVTDGRSRYRTYSVS